MGLPSKRVPQEPSDNVQYDRTSERVASILYASPVLSFLDVGVRTGTIESSKGHRGKRFVFCGSVLG